MDLRQLRNFVAIARVGNFRRAADVLNIAQPALSVSIGKLEAELGLKLLERGARGAWTTPAGTALIELAEATLAQAEKFRMGAEEIKRGERARLTIAFVGSAATLLLPELIARFRDRYPLVDLTLIESTSAEIVKHVKDGSFGAGIVRLPLLEGPQFHSTTIESDQFVVAMPHSHSLAGKSSLRLEDLATEPFVAFASSSVLRATFLFACHEAGFVPTIAQEATHLQTVLGLVRSGLGLALVPSIPARAMLDTLRLVPLAQPVATEIGLIMPRIGALTAARNLLEIARCGASARRQAI